MYTPDPFAEPRPDELHRLIREHPLGLLVTHGAGGLDANHLPFLLDEEGGAGTRLLAHVARANPLWTQLADGAEVLVVFRGAQGYISPNWYPSKQETHRHVPTWNYEVVHAHGRIHVHDDARFVRGVVARLTRTHEAGEPQPWKMSDAPADFLDDVLAQIVGIEIEVTRLEGKRKLSQNRDARDFASTVAALETRGHTALAAAMRRANG
jgi:transcriptional regulator